MPFECPDEKRHDHHRAYPEGEGDPRPGPEPEGAARAEECVRVHAAVEGEKGEEKEYHLPKHTPRPSAIFTSSPSGSTSLRELIAFSRETDVMTGGGKDRKSVVQ